ncbi:HlyU family transcriptional regulator [Moritella viscosa]|uniref:Transcriptional regulator n=1 Tax=Moritella viscosa TaxID=80854 RepID=A0A090ILN1_9GAMM|nr:HlyU family transcriptional regulator [Moritella viscosa]CED61314.1 putative uncharacterized protein [Moritella viscosa]SGY88462.1 Putative uncharacterized protein [Moritella viscosa]SGY91872.1 Putative uncharacterized protein [Moritella viscosa]SGY91883.1 Putative uncharacterized protein [Moritella viscosa]SGY95453.1 Putative uncharacterized protein [Moritella viscosa]
MFGLLKRFFSDSDDKPVDNTPSVEPVHYNDYLIFVMPKEEGGQYRVAGFIEKPIVKDPVEQGNDEKENEVENLRHLFIRSDVCMSKQQAEQITLQKCKLFIDQVGDNMFK